MTAQGGAYRGIENDGRETVWGGECDPKTGGAGWELFVDKVAY